MWKLIPAIGEKISLMGASSGLGSAFYRLLTEKGFQVQDIQKISRSNSEPKVDFTNQTQWVELAQQIQSFGSKYVFYFSGGGPHGEFAKKNFADHQWAWKLNFEFPAFLIHSYTRNPGSIKRLIFIGSKIAESQPDPFAASYAAGKHALRGLVTSLQAEQSLPFDLQLFSPGYIDTKLLPPNAWPRQQQGLVESAEKVALQLWMSLQS